jgi:FkbM family methyltransferase
VIKDLVRTLARCAGLEVHRYIPARSHAAQLEAMLVHHGVNLIFDVGANVGQFGSELRRHIHYRGRIVSFEPTRESHAALLRNVEGDKEWVVAERAALGGAEGVIDMNVSANSVSSSALPMLEAHLAAAPGSAYTAVETVRLTTLDTLAVEYFQPGTVAFLKIDTQGYEDEVLKGARRTLGRSVGVQLELSLTPLYAGQKLLPEMLEQITAQGFELWAMVPVFADAQTGRLLQVDATFFRSATSSVGD